MVRVLGAVLSGWLALAGSALAQESSEEPSVESGESEPNSADARARQLFEEGEQDYTAGRFEEALEKFRQAYDLSGRAGLLYNVGLSAMNIGEDRQALEAFEAYLDGVENAPNRALVEGRITTLRRRIASEEQEQRRLTEAVARAAEGGSSPALGWILTGTGAALAIGGGVLFALGLSDVSSVENADEGTPWSDLSGANDRAPIFTGVGIAAASVGVAVAALGLVLVATSGGPAEEEAEEEVSVGPGFVRGTF
jgi:tetratricopeptide (TPR) repeat protein